MEKLMLVNGSPRAPRSNTKKYLELFRSFWGAGADEYLVTARTHREACAGLAEYTDLLLAFPLYVDGLPAPLMEFLKELRRHDLARKPAIHVLINCGFLEPEQNQVAVDMVRLFCAQNGFAFGSVLQVGSGEAILGTPFAFLVKGKLKKLARAIRTGRPGAWRVTMPLPKKTFLGASTKYWVNYGAQNGVTREQMDTMEIEGGPADR